MPSQHHCPSCKSTDVIEYDEYIECTSCNLEFFKDGLDEIEDENKLSVQELKGIFGAFKELDSAYKRGRFQKSLEEDDQEEVK